MVTAFPEVILKIAEHAGLHQKTQVIDRIVKQADFEVSGENILSHKRSVKPGNHLKKLKRATVDELNEALSGILELFDYR